MFNSIQDAIFIVKDFHVKFMNSLAASIFKDKNIEEG